MVEIINGDLLESGCDIIVHQLNCITVRSLGLSKSIAEKYPYADVYSKRKPVNKYKNVALKEDWGVPGTIAVRDDFKKKGPTVVGIYGQFSPGIPGKYHNNLGKDTCILREQWFHQGLVRLVEYIENIKDSKTIKRIGFPYKIGCGLGGGSWSVYKLLIDGFVKELNSVDSNIKVEIYKPSKKVINKGYL